MDIVTETYIYRFFVQLLGHGEGDQLLVLENIQLKQRTGIMSRIAGIIEGIIVPVLALFSLPRRRQTGHRLYIRIHTDKTQAVVEALAQVGYKLGD